MFLLRLLLAGMISLTSALAQSQRAPDPSAAIAGVRAEWVKDLHDKRLDQIVMLYAPDAVFLPPNGERVTGRDAIRELTKRAMDTFTSDLTFKSISFDSSGTLAYDSGEFSEALTNVANGSISHGQGNYLMVFKHQPDGNWLIVQQVWTESALAQP